MRKESAGSWARDPAGRGQLCRSGGIARVDTEGSKGGQHPPHDPNAHTWKAALCSLSLNYWPKPCPADWPTAS